MFKNARRLSNVTKPLHFQSKVQSFSTVAAIQLNHTSIIQQYHILNKFLKFKPRKMKKTKIISHRGRSDLYPQNTFQAISEALLTSDLAQFDIMLTKDNQVIVFHDRSLGILTNIAFLPQFQNKKTINDLNQHGQIPHPQWWVKQFTLEQLKKLCVRQKHATRPQIMQKEFHIPTLDELLKKCLEVKSTTQKTNNSGLLMQIKTQRQNLKTLERDLILLQKIDQILKANNLDTKQKCEMQNLPIIVQSFNQQALKCFHGINPSVPLFHLYGEEDEHVSQDYLAQHRTKASLGVGVSTKNLTRQFIQICHRMKYEIFYWSVMDDKPEIPFGCQNYEECYQNLKFFGVDGIITDFAANCRKALSALVV